MSYRQTRKELETEIIEALDAACGEWAGSPEPGEATAAEWRIYRCLAGNLILARGEDVLLREGGNPDCWAGQLGWMTDPDGPQSDDYWLPTLRMAELADLRRALPSLARQAGEIMGRAEGAGRAALQNPA